MAWRWPPRPGSPASVIEGPAPHERLPRRRRDIGLSVTNAVAPARCTWSAAYAGDVVVDAPAIRHRAQSRGEELANSISHGTGFLAALIALPVLVLGAGRHGTAALVGAGVFAATVALLYLTSTLYHALAPNRAKRVFQILDHGAIYLLIAGTYTPFTLGVLRGPWGWTLFGLIWALAVVGIVLKSVRGRAPPAAVDRAVPGHGLADSGRGTAVVARDAGVGALLARGRWGRVHGGCGVLCGAAGCGTPTSCGTCSSSRARRVTSLRCSDTRPNPRGLPADRALASLALRR